MVEALLVQFFLHLHALEHQWGPKSTHTSHQQSEARIGEQKLETVQVVMATPGCDRAGPPSCTAGGVGPPSLLKVCFCCPFRIMLGLVVRWPYLEAPWALSSFLQTVMPPCSLRLWRHSPILGSLCPEVQVHLCWGLVRHWQRLLAGPVFSALSRTVCCSGSRLRGDWNHVFVNRA